MKNRWIGCLALVLFLFQVQWAQAEFVVSYRPSSPMGDKHHIYSANLLRLTLEKTRPEYGDYRMEFIPRYSFVRAVKAAMDNAYPNLVIETSYEPAVTSHANLDYINFPIDLGVLGYRVCFINPALKASGTKIETLEQLRQYNFGHGIGWSDTIIFRHNGLKVQEIEFHNGIFLMLLSGRIDFFCRGINELEGELEQTRMLTGLSFDDHFMLVYPLPRFFYINVNNKLAKERISLGLARAYADGSLQALWKASFMPSIDLVKFKQRKIIRLENPLLNGVDLHFSPSFMPLLEEAKAQPQP